MSKNKKISFGTDHSAIKIRNKVKNFLEKSGYEVYDFGFYGIGTCDYPDYAIKVAKSIINKESDKGILICGTGIGMSIAANKIKGIIAAVCWNEYTAKLSAQHNMANILCLGSRILTVYQLCYMISIFLKTKFDERHLKRIIKIENIKNF
jgi:ribose 5-phosphate isomerase B